MSQGAVLFSQMQPGADWEDDFNDWYNHEHVPVRLAIDGFTGACRYTVVGAGVKYAVAYYMTGLDVLQTPAYSSIKRTPGERTEHMLASVTGFTRYLCEQTQHFTKPGVPEDPAAAPYLYPVLFSVPADRADEFDRWYNEEHCPILMKCPDWWQIRRYKIASNSTPDTYTHLAFHYLGSLAALDSPERQQARQTPWRAKLAAEPWFKAEYAVYQQLRAFPTKHK